MPANSDVPEPGRWDKSQGWGPPPPGWGQRQSSDPTPTPDAPPVVKPGVIELRPLGFGDLFDGTFAVLRLAPIPTLLNAVLAQLLPVVAAVLLLLPLSSVLELPSSMALPAPGDWVPQLERKWPSYSLGFGFYLVVQLLAAVLVVGPTTVAAMRATLNLRTSWRQSLTLSAKAMPRLAGWNLLVGAAVVLAVVLSLAATVVVARYQGPVTAVGLLFLWVLVMGMAYVWLAIKLCFGPIELVVRSMAIGGAMASSWRLVRGSWWRILGIALVVSIVLGAVGGVVVQILGVLWAQLASGGVSLVLAMTLGFATQAVVGAVCMVLSQIMLTLLHVDARIRHVDFAWVLHAESLQSSAHPIPGHGARGD